MEGDLVSTASSVSNVTTDALFPFWVEEVVSLARNIALIAIPFVLWFANKRSERRRATLDVVRRLDRDITPHLERLFCFRRFEGSEDNQSSSNCNPYDKTPALFFFDSVIVLNFYEAISTEIRDGALEEELLYKSIRNSLIGAKDVVLERYNLKTENDQSIHYENLSFVSKRWKSRAEKKRELGATKIPD